MYRRRPKAMRGKNIRNYLKMIELKNRDLRQALKQTERGADEINALVNAILAAVVDEFGAFDIEMPKIGRNVTCEKRDGRLYLSPGKDTQGPDTCGDTKCQEGTSTTPT